MCLYLRHVLFRVVGLELTNPIENTKSALGLDQCVRFTFTQKRLFTLRCFFKLLWASNILKRWTKCKVMVQVLALSFVLNCLASCLPGICDRKGTSKNYFLEFADDEDIHTGLISATHFLWYRIICPSYCIFLSLFNVENRDIYSCMCKTKPRVNNQSKQNSKVKYLSLFMKEVK